MIKKAENINEYIAVFPKETQILLMEIRKIIAKNAPEATEKISYGMPCFFLHGNLVYFAGYNKHIGFYPSGSGIEAFKHKLDKYKWSKGAIQFPIDKPLPVKLISDIVKYRVKFNIEKLKLKSAGKKA